MLFLLQFNFCLNRQSCDGKTDCAISFLRSQYVQRNNRSVPTRVSTSLLRKHSPFRQKKCETGFRVFTGYCGVKYRNNAQSFAVTA